MHGPARQQVPAAVSRPDDIRRHNLGLVLREVHRNGPLSRAQLTQRLALSRSTIGTLVTDLCGLGLLEALVPVGGERAGRPSHVVGPRPDGPYVVAVDLGVDRLTVAAVTVGGGVARRRVHVLDPGHRSAEETVRVLAEHLRGAARGARDVVYVLGAVGVGAGILVDGHRLRGAGGLVGELGHTVIEQNGRPCHCGAHGCVEGVIGEEAILRLSGRAGPPDPEAVASVLADAQAGDPGARAGVAQVARSLGQVLANLTNLLNPEVIVLGGSLAGVFRAARDDVLAELDDQAMAAARAMVDIRVSALGADSSLLGAAELAFQDILADPLVAASR